MVNSCCIPKIHFSTGGWKRRPGLPGSNRDPLQSSQSLHHFPLLSLPHPFPTLSSINPTHQYHQIRFFFAENRILNTDPDKKTHLNHRGSIEKGHSTPLLVSFPIKQLPSVFANQLCSSREYRASQGNGQPALRSSPSCLIAAMAEPTLTEYFALPPSSDFPSCSFVVAALSCIVANAVDRQHPPGQ